MTHRTAGGFSRASKETRTGTSMRVRVGTGAWTLYAAILLGSPLSQAQVPHAALSSDYRAPGASSSSTQAAPATPSASVPADLRAVIEGSQRTAAFQARDIYRHPAETLAFFGLRPDMKVVEIWPGNGWYTEILAPYVNESGLLYEALPADANNRGSASSGSAREAVAFSQKLASNPRVYGKVVIVPFVPPTLTDLKPPGGADLILTFRNVHNWMKNGTTDAVFTAMFAALKPGGTVGVVEHRAHAGTSVQKMIETGYVTEQYVIDHARAAGLTFVARSEINANPKDDTEHAHGVWSLPPSYAGGATDHASYEAIGESDRMTLKFVKRR